MIQTKTYSIKNLPLTNELLVNYISKFWEELFSSIKDTKHLLILSKVQFIDNEMGYRTIGHLRKVNFDDKQLYIDYLSQYLSILNESYLVQPILNITFSYVVKDGLCSDKDRALLTELGEKLPAQHSFNNLNLPISMEPGDYGEIIASSYVDVGGISYHRFIVKNGNKVFQIDRSLDRSHNKVTILGNIDLYWIDTKLTELGTDIFKREIKKSTIYFMDGEIVLRKQIQSVKPFRKLLPDNRIVNKFLTMDIETITKNNKITPYLITGYDGRDFLTSYGQDEKALFKVFFDQLLTKVKSSTTIYAHNLSGFDGVFLMKHLLNYGKVEPLLFNGKLITIKVKIIVSKNESKILIFKDSYLLLPLSLRKLCKAFNIELGKGYFPFKLTNIFYSGVIPRFEYWTGLSLSEYGMIKANYKSKLWNFQQESIKYCKLDCQVLHQILTKFNELIFNEFKINIHSVLTLPSLAMKIYKTHYMPENTIYQLLGRVENNIRQSYTGARRACAVDVYIPHNRITEFFKNIKSYFIELFYYDVNSLYPFIMGNTPMPIGKPIAFTGDIRKYEPNAYGFFYCKITTPEFLEHPLLQRRIKTSNGMRTIAGLGCWTGWISSVEMDNAVKYGYTFEIMNGYQFETGNIFKEYILKMYNLRQQYDKSHAMNLIAKLLMNSLYGKFGMKLESTEIDMYDTSNPEGELSLRNDMETWGETIQDFVKIDYHFLIIRNTRLSIKYNEKEDMYHGQDINIAIASAITAGARVHMSYFKNNPDLYESKELLEGIFNAITTHPAFINFGINKSIILSAVMNKEITLGDNPSLEYNLHHNVLITPTTTFNEYYTEVGHLVNSKLEHGYSYEVIEYYKVKVWNLDLMKNSKIKLSNKGRIDFLGYRSFSTSTICLGRKGNISISPINVDKSTNSFATMDIETMNINGIQLPVAISTCNGVRNNNSKLFIIDHKLLQTSPDLAIKNLWKEYFDYLIKSGNTLIFAHNLGSFDGYFLYKGLLNHFDPIIVEALIDDSKSFISISLNINDVKIIWKDSIRIFPMSLDKLCQMFNVDGKLISYNIRFNDISLFKSGRLWGLFKKYALQDAIGLYNALKTAQAIYFNNFNIDITTIFSSPTLSLKIFRSKFLNLSIPILFKNVDEFVRNGYYGGGTD
jgi:hypothetical protein